MAVGAAYRRGLASGTSSLLQYLLVMGGLGYLIWQGAQAMDYDWQWHRVPQYFWRRTDAGFEWGELPVGLVATLILSGLAFVLALALGLVVALLRLSGLVTGRALAVVFLELVRNTPLLVLIYLFYYVLGPIFDMDRTTAAVVCLGVFHGALMSEIFRAGINAVPAGQWEAARSIGLTPFQVHAYVVLPQTVRFLLPPMTGEAIHLVKSSAIVSVIAVAELTTMGRNIISDTYMSFEIWFTIAAMYLVVTLALSVLAHRLERAYAVAD
ncbi:amino acid ABC transporter permease [Paracoccaceae bacterium Fryx2]|nr:amino acid ABC transporter permease [Paracoccaceae bacterium Fryx2]